MARTEEEYSQQSMAQLPTEQGEWVTYNLLVKFTHFMWRTLHGQRYDPLRIHWTAIPGRGNKNSHPAL